MKLINAARTTIVDRIYEADLKNALILEAAETRGLTTDGKLTKGVSGRITWHGDRRSPATCFYQIELTFDQAAAQQARLPKPEGSA
jgi:hypothetical protein